MWTKTFLTRNYQYRRRFRRFSDRLRDTKFLLCVIIILFLNVVTGFQYYIRPVLGELFQDKDRLPITRVDVSKLQENDEYLGRPNNTLPNVYPISNKYLCGKGDRRTTKPPYLLILVKSAIENREARQAIRMTWGDKHRMEQHHLKLAFVLGINEHNTSVEEESKLYEDIIQIDKIDSYHHLTHKTVMMLRWVTDNCLSESLQSLYNDIRNYVLFIDDDYYLNVDALVKYLKLVDEDQKMTTYERQTFITGYVHESARPRRNPSSRWYISMTDYPYDHYPPFLGGGCILMTRYNARLFYLASKYMRVLPLEDVYIGLLAHSMSIHLVKNNRRVDPFNSKTNWYKTILLSLRRFFFGDETRYCVTGYRGEQLLTLWNQLHQSM